jgi:hypothetical protein
MQMSFVEFLMLVGAEGVLLVCAVIAGMMIGRKHPSIATLIAQDAATLEAALGMKNATTAAAVNAATAAVAKKVT